MKFSHARLCKGLILGKELAKRAHGYSEKKVEGCYRFDKALMTIRRPNAITITGQSLSQEAHQ